jgi:hypothetical protein
MSGAGGYPGYQPPPAAGSGSAGPTYPPPSYPAPHYGYGPGYGPAAYGAQPRNGMGTAGLVLGIIGIVFCWALWLGWILNVLAIIFGGVGVARANHGIATNKSSAMAGLVLGIIGLVVGIGIWVLLGAAWRASIYW